jgi:hypothetical protein
VASEARPLLPLAESYKDDGFVIIVLRIAYIMVLMAVLHACTYDRLRVATKAAVFSLGPVAIVDRRVRTHPHQLLDLTCIATGRCYIAWHERRMLNGYRRGIVMSRRI